MNHMIKKEWLAWSWTEYCEVKRIAGTKFCDGSSDMIFMQV